MRRTIGLDIHKRETRACIMTKTGRVLEVKRFPTRRLAFRNELAKYEGSSTIIESIGFHRPVAKWLGETRGNPRTPSAVTDREEGLDNGRNTRTPHPRVRIRDRPLTFKYHAALAKPATGSSHTWSSALNTPHGGAP